MAVAVFSGNDLTALRGAVLLGAKARKAKKKILAPKTKAGKKLLAKYKKMPKWKRALFGIIFAPALGALAVGTAAAAVPLAVGTIAAAPGMIPAMRRRAKKAKARKAVRAAAKRAAVTAYARPAPQRISAAEFAIRRNAPVESEVSEREIEQEQEQALSVQSAPAETVKSGGAAGLIPLGAIAALALL